jgi:uncharacterized membrane protein YkoI
MNSIRLSLIAAALAVVANASWAQTPSKEQLIEKALAAHPGVVEEVYQETKKGVDAWEVKIKGDDGHTWEVYYRADNGDFFMEEKD